MKIEVKKPHPDYPLAFVHVPVNVNTDREDLLDILATQRLTLLGRWEPHVVKGVIESVKAPVLLEDEHVKPRKTPARRKK